MHAQLLIGFVSLIGLRIPHYLRKFCPGDFVDAGPVASVWKGKYESFLKNSWYMLLVFFTLWTIVGSLWLAEVVEHTPTCLPMSTSPYFIVFWQVVCYLWVVIYTVCVALAFALRHRQQLAEQDLREVESADTQARWGSISAHWGLAPNQGLKPKEISSLPTCSGRECKFQECPICLVDFEDDDAIRCLPTCGHRFHQACIDLWLLRQNKCPLCKGDAVQRPCSNGTDACQRLV